MLHYSEYNHIVKIPSGGWMLYNFRTGLSLSLDIFRKDTYDHALELGPDHHGVRKLLKYGFLVNYDEKAYMLDLALKTAGRTDSLGLSICPTMDCNFNCPYCFEQSRPGYMSEQVQKDIVLFVEKLFSENHPKRLMVSWFGGEPLLGIEVIEKLSENFIKMCEEYSAEYSANIITNGYFFNQKTADRLERCKVSEAQITLDGPNAEIHDKTRCLKGGQGSFAIIMNNLNSIRTAIAISIRCNVQKDNEKDYCALERIMQSVSERTGNTIRISPARMEGGLNPERNGYCEPEEMSIQEFSYLAQNKNNETDKRLRFRGVYCMSQMAYSFGIDELGNLYKCWEAIGYGGKSFGNVADFDYYKEHGGDINNYLMYHNTLFFNADEECMRCKVLPVCLGGCPNRRITRGQHRCEPIKYTMDEYVLSIAEKENRSCII